MSVRAIIEIECCRSSPKFETIALLAQELNISLDAVTFPNAKSGTVSKSVADFFADKGEAESQRYIGLCRQAENIKER